MRVDRAIDEADAGPAARSGLRMVHVWILVAVAVPLIDSFMSRIPTADLAYQIRAGELMLRTHSLLRTDVFTFTVPGTEWLNQQWGAQVLLGAVHQVGGWNGIVLARAALTSIAFLFVFLACRRVGASTRGAALLTVAGFWVARENLAMRPQLIGVVLFSVTLWVIAGRRSNPRALWAIPVIMLVWANVHGSFVLVPLLLGLAWLEDRKDHPTTARTILVVGAVSLMASLVNPFGARVWAYAIGIGTNPTIAHTVTEWAPPTIHDETGIVFFGSALIVAGYLARRKEPIAWPQLALLATFFVVGLQASRGIVWWALVFPVGVASLVAWKPTTEEPRGSPLMNALLVTSICATAVIVMPFWRAGPSTQPPAYLIQAPASLVDAMASALPPGSRLFVSQTYASWFEFALPSMPVFVDSRIELFPTSIWDEYLDVRDAREGWQATLDGWDVDAVVINPDQDGAFIEPMNDDPAWRLAFHDAQGYLFVRS